MSELNHIIEQIGASFEQFKAENDKRLNQIEKNGYSASDQDEKLNKINAKLDDLSKEQTRIEAALNRSSFSTGGKEKSEHAKAFNSFVRRGQIQAAMSTQVGEDGGFLVPEELDTMIGRIAATSVSMRQLAQIQSVGSLAYKKFVTGSSAASGWVGEEASRAATAAPGLKALEFPARECYAMPISTQVLLDDAFVDVESWLANELGVAFAEKEGEAFISGDGVTAPRGILSYTPIANASYTWGSVGFIVSGASGAFVAAANGPADCLISTLYALKEGYRNNASWIMAGTTQAAVRALKDTSGQYLWQPSVQAGQPATLLGRPVVTDDYMPVIAANSYSIAVGDFNRAYLITDRVGTRIIRDDLTNKPYVQFYATRRVGGGIQNFEALKLVKFST